MGSLRQTKSQAAVLACQDRRTWEHYNRTPFVTSKRQSILIGLWRIIPIEGGRRCACVCVCVCKLQN